LGDCATRLTKSVHAHPFWEAAQKRRNLLKLLKRVDETSIILTKAFWKYVFNSERKDNNLINCESELEHFAGYFADHFKSSCDTSRPAVTLSHSIYGNFPCREVKRLSPSETNDLDGTGPYVIKECPRIFMGERGSVVSTSRKVAGSIPDEVIGFFN
jgi:hypothetical protein